MHRPICLCKSIFTINLLILLLTISACGNATVSSDNGTHSSSPVTTATMVSSEPSPTPSEPPPTPTPLPPITPAASFLPNSDLLAHPGINAFNLTGQLRIDPVSAGCGLNSMGSNVVLATDRLSYDSGEIQEMTNYIDTNLDINPHSPIPLPSTLQTVVGFFQANISNWGMININCLLTFYVTNTGTDMIQIDKATLKFTSDAVPNTYHYRLIDICTLPLTHKSDLCPIGKGLSGKPYWYDYELGAEKADTDVSSVSVTPGATQTSAGDLIDGSRETIVLNAGDTAEIVLNFSPKDVSSPYIYSFVPELTIDTTGTTETVDIEQFRGNIAFLDPHQQVTCYELQGNTFSPIEMGVLQDTTPQEVNSSRNCL